MVSQWDCWMIFEQNRLYLVLCNVNSLVDCKFVYFRCGCPLYGKTFMYLWFGLQHCERFFVILWVGDRILSWSFYGVLLNIWSEPSTIEVNIICWITQWDAFHKIFTIWGYCAFPNYWNFGNSSSNTTWNLGEAGPVSGLTNRATGPARNG